MKFFFLNPNTLENHHDKGHVCGKSWFFGLQIREDSPSQIFKWEKFMFGSLIFRRIFGFDPPLPCSIYKSNPIQHHYASIYSKTVKITTYWFSSHFPHLENSPSIGRCGFLRSGESQSGFRKQTRQLLVDSLPSHATKTCHHQPKTRQQTLQSSSSLYPLISQPCLPFAARPKITDTHQNCLLPSCLLWVLTIWWRNSLSGSCFFLWVEKSWCFESGFWLLFWKVSELCCFYNLVGDLGLELSWVFGS